MVAAARLHGVTVAHAGSTAYALAVALPALTAPYPPMAPLGACPGCQAWRQVDTVKVPYGVIKVQVFTHVPALLPEQHAGIATVQLVGFAPLQSGATANVPLCHWQLLRQLGQPLRFGKAK